MSGAPVIVLDNAALVNDGECAPGNSTLVFTGSAGSPFIGGNSPLALYHLTLRKTYGSLLLDNDISVGGNLDMHSGNLELNNHTVDLGSSGSILEERNEARITGSSGGTITATALLNAPHAVNPGNIGVEITSPANPGLTTITRGHVQQYDAGGETSIRRYFDIQPATNGNLQASLRFYYFDDELAGNDQQALALFAKNGAHDWTLSGRDNTGAADGSVTKTGIDQLNRFTLAIAKDALQANLLTASALAYPNPSRDAFTLSISTKQENDYVINLYSQQGQLLEIKRIHCLAGANQLQWDIRKYAAGSYYLRFNQPGIKSIAIIKQ